MVEMFIVQKELFVLEIDLVFFFKFNMDKNRFPNLVNGTKNELHGINSDLDVDGRCNIFHVIVKFRFKVLFS